MLRAGLLFCQLHQWLLPVGQTGFALPFHALKSQKRKDGELFILGDAYSSGRVLFLISRDAEVKKQNLQQWLMKGLETMYRIRQWDQLQEEKSRCQSKVPVENQYQMFSGIQTFPCIKMSSGGPSSTDWIQQLGMQAQFLDTKYKQTLLRKSQGSGKKSFTMKLVEQLVATLSSLYQVINWNPPSFLGDKLN